MRRLPCLVLVAGALLLGCEGVSTVDEAAPGDPDVVDRAGPDVALPEVVRIPVAEVDADAAASPIDLAVAAAATELPEDWAVTVVPDGSLGPFVLGLPQDATVWRVGEDPDALLSATQDEAWVAYWEPILTDAAAAAEGATLRSVVSLRAPDGEAELHLTVTATPQQDLPVDDPPAVADAFADTFEEQGLDVVEAGTVPVDGTDVAAIVAVTPSSEFADGVPRRLRQWFLPETASSVLWSITCEAPEPAAEVADAVCPTVLASFRPPPR